MLFTAVIMQMALVMQIMVVTVYWPVLHAHVLIEIAPLNDIVIYWIMVYIHFWPFLAVLFNVLLTKVVF